MDLKEFNKHIAGVKREIGSLRLSIYEVIGYGKDAESELNCLENKLEELEKRGQSMESREPERLRSER